MKLHIGGTERLDGWTVLNTNDIPEVTDIVGNAVDLSMIGDETCDEVYASHVLEHLGYESDLPKALTEIQRVLTPMGVFSIGVPDLLILCRLFCESANGLEEKVALMRVMYGGRVDKFDEHRTGMDADILSMMLGRAGFVVAERVPPFTLFNDMSRICFKGVPFTLCMKAYKHMDAAKGVTGIQAPVEAPPDDEPPPLVKISDLNPED